jgi:hypothetical protein
MKASYLLSAAALLCSLSYLPALAEKTEKPFWSLNQEGGITWTNDGRAHTDHIEMAGRQMAVVLHYGITAEGRFSCERHLVFPMLRTIPNDTHASFIRYVNWEPLQSVLIGQSRLIDRKEQVDSISLKGMMTVQGRYGTINVKRTLSPSPTLPALVEEYRLTNLGDRTVSVRIEPTEHRMTSDAAQGVDGAYVVEEQLYGTGTFRLEPQQSLTFSAVLSARRQIEQPLVCDVSKEIAARQKLVDGWQQNLILDTPDSVLNRMFSFSKIRACESIYETKNGPMHGPGGERYYAAIWANDQAEYANPFFPFIGDSYANASAMNSWRMFASWMNDDWKPIPSSIIAEGTDYWNGAGDRGDAAMIAYGASRYALARGDKSEAEQLWPLIQWTLEYCRRQLNEAGVVHSDRDELEGRFPSGDANLCTSSLYYDALLSAAYLARDLKKPASIAKAYEQQARDLRKSIDNFFHAEVEGFDTYRYYDGNTVLRSWICIPLTMGIFERAKGTIDALYSPRLWTKDGMLTQAGSETFWDRSTLYALRGALMAGDTEHTLPFLQYYSSTRLLGSHVPYAIEAWPEGNQRHLAAESALYARIITEGLFGIRPTGLRSFSVSPRLPEAWSEITLRHIRICGGDFDLRVYRDNKQHIRVQLIKGGKVIKESAGKAIAEFNV